MCTEGIDIKTEQGKTPVRICIRSERYAIASSLFDTVMRDLLASDDGVPLADHLMETSEEEELLMGILEDEASESGLFVKPADPSALRALLDKRENIDDVEGIDRIEMITEGYITVKPTSDGDEEVTITYEESEATGMEGATLTLTYQSREPDLLHLIRSGSVTTAMTFKPRHRALCIYQTPYMPFQVGIHCLSVQNTWQENGQIKLDYIIEIRGGQAERCAMTIRSLT